MDKNVTIRQAHLSDAPALGHIQVTSWRSAFRGIASDAFLDHMVSPEDQAEDWKGILVNPAKVIFVAEMDQRSVGYAWAQPEQDKSRGWDAELISMHMLPGYKRRGIGRKLLSAVATKLKEQGYASLYLWVLEENYSARKFYEALGGQLTGKQPITLGDSKLTEVAYGWRDVKQLEITE